MCCARLPGAQFTFFAGRGSAGEATHSEDGFGELGSSCALFLFGQCGIVGQKEKISLSRRHFSPKEFLKPTDNLMVGQFVRVRVRF